MRLSPMHTGHKKGLLAILCGGVVCAAAIAACAFGTHSEEKTTAVIPAWEAITGDTVAAQEEDTYVFHDGDTLESIITVLKGTDLTIRSENDTENASVKVGLDGGSSWRMVHP